MIHLKTVTDSDTGDIWDEWIIQSAEVTHGLIEEGTPHE